MRFDSTRALLLAATLLARVGRAVVLLDGLELGMAKVENGFISGMRLAFEVLGVSNKDFVQIDFDIAMGR